MFLAQFEGSPETLSYKEGKLVNSSPPINVPRKVHNLTFSVNGIKTENGYFIAKDSPEYPIVRGKNYFSKEYGEFLTSLGFLVLPRSNNPGMLPEASLMKKFTLVGWTDGEAFIPYSSYTGKGKLICKSIEFSIKDNGTLMATLSTGETQFTTTKHSIYSKVAVGSEIMFSSQGDLIVVTGEALAKIEVPGYCPACRRRLEVSSCADERFCVNTECDNVRHRFIQKLLDLGIYNSTADLPIEYLISLNRKDILKAVCGKSNNTKILNNLTVIQLLEIPDTESIVKTLPLEYPLAVLLTNQTHASEQLKNWMKTNSKLFNVALDVFETPRKKKVAYKEGSNSPLSIDTWYEQTVPEKADAFFYSGRFFLGV